MLGDNEQNKIVKTTYQTHQQSSPSPARRNAPDLFVQKQRKCSTCFPFKRNQNLEYGIRAKKIYRVDMRCVSADQVAMHSVSACYYIVLKYSNMLCKLYNFDNI